MLEINLNSHVSSKKIWYSALTKENTSDIERVQKKGNRIMMKEKFTTYENSLKELQMENLKK